MAKKEETISLIDTFSEFKELKNIDRTTMVSVLEESFRSVIAKMFGTDENYDVIVNPDKGDFEIWRNREVVADKDLENPNLQISLSEAQKIDASYEASIFCASLNAICIFGLVKSSSATTSRLRHISKSPLSGFTITS